MPNPKEELINKALDAVEESGETNSSVIGADSSVEARQKIADLLYPDKIRKTNGGKKKIRTKAHH